MKNICINELENVSGGNAGLFSIAALLGALLYPPPVGDGTMDHRERLDAIAAQQRDGFYGSEPF